MPIADLVKNIVWMVGAIAWLVLLGLVAWLAYSARRSYFRTKNRVGATLTSLVGAVLGWWVGVVIGFELPMMRIVVDEYDFSSAAYAVGALGMMAGAWAGIRMTLHYEEDEDPPDQSPQYPEAGDAGLPGPPTAP